MGTRSVLAVPTGSTWRGRYCHWDGYPDHMLPALEAIVARDGVDLARKTLTELHYSWSQIDPNAPAEYDLPSDANTEDRMAFLRKHGRSAITDDGPGFELVPGYGIAHTTNETTSGGGASADDWITPHSETWCEYAYIIHQDRIDVVEF